MFADDRELQESIASNTRNLKHHEDTSTRRNPSHWELPRRRGRGRGRVGGRGGHGGSHQPLQLQLRARLNRLHLLLYRKPLPLRRLSSLNHSIRRLLP